MCDVKRLWLLIILIVMFSVFSAFAMADTYKPGDIVEAEFAIQANPNQTAVAKVCLTYDMTVLELIPNQLFKTENGVALLTDLNVGDRVNASFKILDDSAPGDYEVTVTVLEASDYDENYVDGLVFSPFFVVVQDNTKIEPSPEPVPSLFNPEAKIEFEGDRMVLHVSWDGGEYPYRVTMYPYINNDHNNGVKYKSSNNALLSQYIKRSETVVHFNKYLTPGKTYWIKITDGANQELWYKYSFPKVSLDGVSIQQSGSVIFEDGDTHKQLGKNEISSRKLGYVKQGDGWSQDISTDIIVKLLGKGKFSSFSDYDNLCKTWSFTIVQPNGELLYGDVWIRKYKDNDYLECELYCPTQDKNEYPYRYIVDKIFKDYQGWDNIPAGKYTVIVSYGNYYVGSQDFIISN